jgi:hypothetical protein
VEISFSKSGYLIPVGKNTIGLDDFKLGFVEAFNESRTRHALYDGYLKYLGEFEKITGSLAGITQWINGSFTTNKLNPNDIDLVSFVENRIVEKYEPKLKSLTSFGTKDILGVDGYIVRVYPVDHLKHFRTISDKAYWNDWFSRTKPNRRRVRHKKGYIEINFS